MSQQSTFQNEHLEVIVKREPGCKVILDVTVTPEATQASYQRAISTIKREVSLPGFRKGKAPDSFVVENFAKHIDKEWKENLLMTSLDEAIKLIKIYPYDQKSVDKASIKKVSKEEGSTLNFEYESSPEIPSVSPETLAISVVDLKPVTESDVEATLERLALEHAEWIPVTDRPAQEEDFVEVDIDNIGENAGNICTNQLVRLKKGQMDSWMLKTLIGMTPGQTVEVMSEEEDCQACHDGEPNHKHAEFAPVLCRFMLHQIKQAKPHAFDDELAKKFGAADITLLRSKIQQTLERRAEEEQKDKQRLLMEKELLAHYPFDLPASLIQKEVNGAKQEFIKSLREQGVEENLISQEVATFQQESKPKYERDYRLYFLTQKYAFENNLKVSEEEMGSEFMQRYVMQAIQTRQPMPEFENVRQTLELQLLAAKAIDEMVKKAAKK